MGSLKSPSVRRSGKGSRPFAGSGTRTWGRPDSWRTDAASKAPQAAGFAGSLRGDRGSVGPRLRRPHPTLRPVLEIERRLRCQGPFALCFALAFLVVVCGPVAHVVRWTEDADERLGSRRSAEIRTSPSMSSITTSVLGCRPSRSRIGLGITTWPCAPYASIHRTTSGAPAQEEAAGPDDHVVAFKSGDARRC